MTSRMTMMNDDVLWMHNATMSTISMNGNSVTQLRILALSLRYFSVDLRHSPHALLGLVRVRESTRDGFGNF